MLLILPPFFSAFISAQGLTQNQICTNACTAAQACSSQCAPGTGHDPFTNNDIHITCLCQTGCLCNAEICLQCCEAGDSDPLASTCRLTSLNAGDVIGQCSGVSQLLSFFRVSDKSSEGGVGFRHGEPSYFSTRDRNHCGPQIMTSYCLRKRQHHRMRPQKLVLCTETAKMANQLRPMRQTHHSPRA